MDEMPPHNTPTFTALLLIDAQNQLLIVGGLKLRDKGEQVETRKKRTQQMISR